MMLRGLFGSTARQSKPVPGDASVPTMTPAAPQAPQGQAGAPRSYLGGLIKYQRPAGQTDAQRMALIGATMRDVGSALGGGSSNNVQTVSDAFRKELEAAERTEKLKLLAEPIIRDNPQARLLFEADPDGFLSILQEQLKPYTMTGGQVRRGGIGQAPVSQSKVEQFGDVYANVDPMSGRVTYSDPRPQTYSERETARSNRADEALGQGRLGVSQAQLALEREKHKARQAAGGYGTPGVGGVIGPELDPGEWDIVQ